MERATTLERELAQYHPADALEDQHRAALLDLLRYGPNAFSRSSFVPGHVTASCFIVDDDERLLVHHHRRLGRWLQMGGHLDAAESPAEAALREGREESGLEDLELVGGIIDVDVHLIPASEGEPAHDHFDVRYLARTKRPDAISMSPQESNDLKWTSLDEAVPLMNEEASARVIRKIRARIGRTHALR